MAAIGQHKSMAMGKSLAKAPAPGRFAAGGQVAPLKTGLPTNPITDAKRANGVPGFKRGGKSC